MDLIFNTDLVRICFFYIA